jgi:hypothetical protein
VGGPQAPAERIPSYGTQHTLYDIAPLSVSLDQQQLFSGVPIVSADQQQQQPFQLFGIAFVFSTDGQQILFCSAHFPSAEQQLFSSGGPCFAIDDDRP